MARTQQERHDYYLQTKQRTLELTDAFRQRNYEYVNAIKSVTPCTDCKVQYPPYVMDFDHVRGSKIKNIAVLVRTSSIARIQEEIDKCEIVCANCHRLRTHERKN